MLLAITSVFILAWFAWIFAMGETVMTDCGLNAGAYGSGSITTDFTVFPPGYDCVYLDDDDLSKVVGRTRADVPSPAEIVGD